jgi:DNA-binding CsgD family transcriptional regulator
LPGVAEQIVRSSDKGVFARADAARLRRRLRTLGVRRRVRSAARATTGWASLTTAELAVTDLAIAGNTNREIADKLFISPHTVNTHLRHVYDKLGVHSRVGLGRLARH